LASLVLVLLLIVAREKLALLDNKMLSQRLLNQIKNEAGDTAERLRASTKRRAEGLLKQAENAGTEAKKKRYRTKAFHTIRKTEERIAKAEAAIASLQKSGPAQR
jgi:hypothetical protein